MDWEPLRERFRHMGLATATYVCGCLAAIFVCLLCFLSTDLWIASHKIGLSRTFDLWVRKGVWKGCFYSFVQPDFWQMMGLIGLSFLVGWILRRTSVRTVKRTCQISFLGGVITIVVFLVFSWIFPIMETLGSQAIVSVRFVTAIGGAMVFGVLLRTWLGRGSVSTP